MRSAALALSAAATSLLPTLAVPAMAATDGRPLWEAGVGGGGGWLPHYPASDEGGFRGLAAPYVIYRGEIFRVGDDGIARSRVVNTSLFELDISLDGSFDAESDENDARRGMPDLDFLAEIGPQLVLKLHRSEREELDVALQVRAAFSTDFSSLDDRGFVYQLRASYETRGLFGGDVGLVLSGGPIFATERLHDYFYQVDSGFAAPGRPAFDAQGGYVGTEAFLGTYYALSEQLTLYAGAQLGLYAGAENADSPLFREDFTAGVLAGFTWSFWRSERRARD